MIFLKVDIMHHLGFVYIHLFSRFYFLYLVSARCVTEKLYIFLYFFYFCLNYYKLPTKYHTYIFFHVIQTPYFLISTWTL